MLNVCVMQAMEHYAKFDVQAAQRHVAPAVLGFFRSVALGQASGEFPTMAHPTGSLSPCLTTFSTMGKPPLWLALQYICVSAHRFLTSYRLWRVLYSCCEVSHTDLSVLWLQYRFVRT